MKQRVWYLFVFIVVMVFGLPGVVLGQPKVLESIDEPEDHDSDDPLLWHRGVSEEHRAKSRAHFQAGNDLIRGGIFADAEVEYRAALEYWDHPGIYYNLAIALINLDEPVAAYEALEKAMGMGSAPLGMDKFEQAQNYRKLLESQLARLEVVCDTPGASVTMNGELLFTGPGRYKSLVQPGGYQLIANTPGSLPSVEQAVLSPGQKARVKLIPWVKKRRWAVWKPWAVTAAGASLLLAAGYFDSHSSDLFREFDAGLSVQCRPNGCKDQQISVLSGKLARAEAEQWAAIGLYVAGSAALVTSTYLAYQNREHWVQEDRPRAVSVTPLLRPGGAMIQGSIHF